MNRQLALDLPFRTAMGAEDFIVTPSNQLAVGLIDRWPSWPAHVLILHGASGSGKTHLAQVWAAMSQAKTASGGTLSQNLESLLRHKTIIVDGIEAVAGVEQEETALFHLCNHAQQGGHMLLTSTLPPAHLAIKLPDLRSRLLSYPEAALLPPDDNLLAALLVKQFSDRQLHIGQEIVDYLLPRIERSAAAAARIVAALDEAALERKSKVTLSLARDVIDRIL